MRRRYFKQSLFFALVTLSAGLLLFSLGGLLVYIFLNGFRAVTWDFLTLPPMVPEEAFEVARPDSGPDAPLRHRLSGSLADLSRRAP